MSQADRDAEAADALENLELAIRLLGNTVAPIAAGVARLNEFAKYVEAGEFALVDIDKFSRELRRVRRGVSHQVIGMIDPAGFALAEAAFDRIEAALEMHRGKLD